MILPNDDLLDTKGPLTDAGTEALASSPCIGNTLEYQPESSSSSRAIVPPTPFEDAPPPSYDFARPTTSATLSYYAPVSPTPEEARAPERPFARAPPGNVTYPSFQPMFLIATGKTLDKGFPYASPPSNSKPHPFVSHDVNEGDWMSFLDEARTAAILTEKQIERSHLPIVSLVPIVNSLASYGVQKIMKHRNASKVLDCIDKWNRHFFEPRKIRIVLMKGQIKVSGQTEYLNDTPTSSNLNSEYRKEEYPPSSSAGIGQGLIGKNDDVYRLFVVPLS